MDAYCTVLHTHDGMITGLRIDEELVDSREKFISLLQSIKGKAQYIEQHELLLIVPIGFGIASVLIHETNILEHYPFIRLMITEDFPNLLDGRKNRLLYELSQCYKLWLGNLGSGIRTNLSAVLENVFEGLVLDSAFTSANRDKAIFPAVLNEMNKYTTHLIVPGINSGRYRPVRLSQIDQLM